LKQPPVAVSRLRGAGVSARPHGQPRCFGRSPDRHADPAPDRTVRNERRRRERADGHRRSLNLVRGRLVRRNRGIAHEQNVTTFVTSRPCSRPEDRTGWGRHLPDFRSRDERPNITRTRAQRGCGDAEIREVLGPNVLRVFETVVIDTCHGARTSDRGPSRRGWRVDPINQYHAAITTLLARIVEEETDRISTILNVFILESLVAETVQRPLARGVTPPVWTSANIPGGAAANQEHMVRYAPRIRWLG